MQGGEAEIVRGSNTKPYGDVSYVSYVSNGVGKKSRKKLLPFARLKR